MRSKVVWLALVALIAAACGETAAPDGGEETSLPTEIGESEGQVNIVAWAGYIERGATDPAYDWVTQFEADSGCQVNVKTAGTSDEMVALMTGSDEYDLVTASGDSSNRLIAGGTVQEINIDLIEGWDTIDPRLQDAPWHTATGFEPESEGRSKHYGVPYQWGANVLAYNTEVFGDTPPTSWSVVFEEQTLPDGVSNAGRVQAYDGPIYVADAALYLGFEQPYALSQEQYDEALNLLRQQRELVGRYWHDAFIQIDDFTNEGVAASSSWPFQVNILQAGGAPVASVFPDEGATGWADTTLMHANAPNPNCAYKWLNHSITNGIQGDLAAWFGTVPAVLAACEGNELLGPEGCDINGLQSFDKIKFWQTPTEDCLGAGGTCVPYYKWVTDYLAVIGGR